jgi:hypothetical protein
MSILGESASAAMFETRDEAESAWEILTDAGIPATVVTDPGFLGKYSVSLEVERDDLDRAVDALKEALAGE